MEIQNHPHLEIIEQPARSGVRFRYECEGQWLGSIPGVNSSLVHPTYPSVQICDYSGNRAMIVVSSVTRDEPFRQHPNHLVGSVHCRNGVYIELLEKFENVFELKRCGIQCAKRSQVRDRLVLRREMGCDPTNGGFDHMDWTLKELHLEAVRLCFQAYIEDEVTGLLTVPLWPVISSVVYDKKVCPSLAIRDISQTCCPMSGAKVMLFCNRIDENDIEVLFYQTDSSGHTVWKASADLKYPHGHFGHGLMSFFAPQYPYRNTCYSVRVFIQLLRPSDQSRSEPIVFTYLPDCPFIMCPINGFTYCNPIITEGNLADNSDNYINYLIEKIINFSEIDINQEQNHSCSSSD